MPRDYSPKEIAKIGKLACSIGATEKDKRFTKKLGFPINESTVGFTKYYSHQYFIFYGNIIFNFRMCVYY